MKVNKADMIYNIVMKIILIIGICVVIAFFYIAINNAHKTIEFCKANGYETYMNVDNQMFCTIPGDFNRTTGEFNHKYYFRSDEVK